MAKPYIFRPITYYDVLAIEEWRYSGFEKFLILTSYHDSYNRGDNPIIGPEGAIGYAVFNNNQLFGLLEFYFKPDGVHLGLAINPDFVGRGFSKGFIQEGIDFLRANYTNFGKIKLEVHRKNIQGIKAYESAGFKFYRRVGDELWYIYSKNYSN